MCPGWTMKVVAKVMAKSDNLKTRVGK